MFEPISMDILISNIILRLNKIGYTTLSSCQSHYNEFNIIYILFDKPYNFKIKPKGFKAFKNKNIIRFYRKIKRNKRFYCKRDKLIDNLNNWINIIPLNY